jgi:hypothetical protein
MFEDKEGDAEKNEEVDVQRNNTKAAPPSSSTQGLGSFKHSNCSRLSDVDYLVAEEEGAE